MGYTILYYGDGKGKTTAALGLALRAAGDNKKTLIIQFIKSVHSSEYKSIAKLFNIEIKAGGKGFYKIAGDKQPAEVHLGAAYHALELAKSALNTKKWHVVILDEIIDAIQWKLIPEKQIIDLIKSKPKAKTLVLTGHKAPKKIIELCDLVTEMKKIKHPYDKGIKAKKGIDY
ncbi:MAG: cob(I)yrinic acid a,c-diamide adenosyltransferase [bacterium]